VYSNIFKLFYAQNRDKIKNSKISESFDRLFLSLGDSYITWGKTIHNTILTEALKHHYPKGDYKNDLVMVPINKGYTAHFRDDYKYISGKTKSIQEFKFDFNYFLCYYKSILNKF